MNCALWLHSHKVWQSGASLLRSADLCEGVALLCFRTYLLLITFWFLLMALSLFILSLSLGQPQLTLLGLYQDPMAWFSLSFRMADQRNTGWHFHYNRATCLNVFLTNVTHVSNVLTLELVV